MASSSAGSYILKTLLVGIIVVGLGWFFDQALLALLIFLTSISVWNLINVIRLNRWIETPDADVPDSFGLWSMVFQKISKLRKTSQKKKKQYHAVIQDFQSLTDALPDATLILNKKGNITWFNNTATELLGLKTPEDLGQPVTNLFRDPEFAHWLAAQDESKSSLEMLSPSNQSTWFNVSAVDYREDQQLLIMTDITDIKNINQMRRDFVANISHELRTPLTVVIGYLEMLQDADEVTMRAVGKMQAQTRKMEELVADLLELSRLQFDSSNGEDEVIDVAAMLVQLREQMDEISGGRHQITMRVEQGVSLLGSTSDIESAFRNLLLNALNYTPYGGKITVCWKATPKGAEFAVTDTGIGIPKKDIPRLTERFYRVNADRARSSGGTGLGLAIVKHALLAHQAKLQIESELGDGSEFRCIFPEARIQANPKHHKS